MTAVEERPAVAEAGPEETDTRTYDELLAEAHALISAHADRMILARQITLGTDSVINRQLCSTGVNEFMARGKIKPVQEQYGVPSAEKPEGARIAEQELREFCVEQFGGDPEDFNERGLCRRIELAGAAHEKWAADFRKLVVDKHRVGHITKARMDEALARLSIELPRVMRHVTVTLRVTYDWRMPKTGRAGTETFQRNELARLRKVLRDFAGPEADWEGVHYGNRTIDHDSYVNINVAEVY